jgi:hypothetical protein
VLVFAEIIMTAVSRLSCGEVGSFYEASVTSLDQRISLIQSILVKDNDGYPTVGFLDAIEELGRHSLRPTLLLIDESAEAADDTDTTRNQVQLLEKVKKVGGQVIVCCFPSWANLNPLQKAALEGFDYRTYQISVFNKLQNQELQEQLKKADFVVVAGFDTNDCVRSTVGARCYNNAASHLLSHPGLMQLGIPVLFDDNCSHGTCKNQWEGERCAETLFFWSRPNSACRLVQQAVREYRQGMESPPDFDITVNLEKLRQLRECVYEFGGLNSEMIVGFFRDFKISRKNPLLDWITFAN